MAELSFLEESIAVLERAPAVYDALLRGLPETWVRATDGPETWSAFDVVGHLSHCERTDWMPRLDMILEFGPARPFEPFDRFAQFHTGVEQTMAERLDEFRELRAENVARLRALGLTAEQLELPGTHPAFGRVTARQLLATWTTHDLGHLVQVNRTLARRYKSEVGPWAEYLSVMQDR